MWAKEYIQNERNFWEAIWSFCHVIIHGKNILPQKYEYLPPREDLSPEQERKPLIIFAEDTARWSVSWCSDIVIIQPSSDFNLTTDVAVPQGETMLTMKCRHLVYLKEVSLIINEYILIPILYICPLSLLSLNLSERDWLILSPW